MEGEGVCVPQWRVRVLVYLSGGCGCWRHCIIFGRSGATHSKRETASSESKRANVFIAPWGEKKLM